MEASEEELNKLTRFLLNRKKDTEFTQLRDTEIEEPDAADRPEATGSATAL